MWKSAPLLRLVLLLAPAAALAGGDGRFQLQPGEYLFTDYITGQQTFIRTTFKIDTRTGETWVAQGVRMEGGSGPSYKVYWMPTEDFVEPNLLGGAPQDWYGLFQRWAENQGWNRGGK